MSLLSFIKDAGEKLFNAGNKSSLPSQTSPSAAAPAPDVNALNKTASDAILTYIASQNLPTQGIDVQYNGATATVAVSGSVPDQETREKIVLCCGNVSSVEHVDDLLTVANPAGEARYYTVKSGDNLSKISKEMYGNPNRYTDIFEANKPMLTNPDKIYPGQMLRIPS